MKEKLKLKPFYLSDEDIKWVEKTKENMSLDEKVAQLFCLIAYTSDEGYLNNLVHNIKPGGLMCRVMPTEDVVKTVSILQQSKIPMLISANIEKGGNGIVTEGTYVGAPLNIGATNDKEMAYKLGVVCGAEGNAVGANWTFAPVIDIDYNFTSFMDLLIDKVYVSKINNNRNQLKLDILLKTGIHRPFHYDNKQSIQSQLINLKNDYIKFALDKLKNIPLNDHYLYSSFTSRKTNIDISG